MCQTETTYFIHTSKGFTQIVSSFYFTNKWSFVWLYIFLKLKLNTRNLTFLYTVQPFKCQDSEYFKGEVIVT